MTLIEDVDSQRLDESVVLRMETGKTAMGTKQRWVEEGEKRKGSKGDRKKRKTKQTRSQKRAVTSIQTSRIGRNSSTCCVANMDIKIGKGEGGGVKLRGVGGRRIAISNAIQGFVDQGIVHRHGDDALARRTIASFVYKRPSWDLQPVSLGFTLGMNAQVLYARSLSAMYIVSILASA